MELRHFPPGGGMPAITGRDARPPEGVGEEELVGAAVAALLDVKPRPLREERVAAGILDGSLIHPREVFAAAVRERAAAVLLLHNHPSGDPAPSGQDREVTRRLRSAGGSLGIPGVDPVILGEAA